MASERQRIEQIWTWWQERGAAAFAHDIEAGDGLPALAAEFSPLVRAVSDGLEWEVGPGAPASQHVLTITSAGDPAYRALAERVVRAAPPADATWRYAAARERADNVMDTTIVIDDVDVATSEYRLLVAPDQSSWRVDVVIGHPAFAAMTEDQSGTAAFLALDWAFGEDDVERWIGDVEVRTSPPEDGLTMVQARAAVDAFAAEHPADDDEWALLRGADDGGRAVMAMARRPLRWIDHLPLDQHIGVVLPYAPNRDGLPDELELDRLRTLEDELEAHLAGSALLTAMVSSAGERELHFYADSADDAPAAAARAWAALHDGVRVDVQADPAWHAVRPYS